MPGVQADHGNFRVEYETEKRRWVVSERVRRGRRPLAVGERLTDALLVAEQLLVARHNSKTPDELHKAWAAARARLRPFWDIARQYEG